MLRKAFLLKIFDAANMQRWNDKIRPVELRELDKQAHKMVIAYFLGKFEGENVDFSWIEVIESGMFGFLQRLVITDLKPQIFYKIKKDENRYKQLNDWVLDQLEPIISPFGSDFYKRFQHYLNSPDDNINKKILNAAHFYATKWEFDILERTNPNGYEILKIKNELQQEQEKSYDLKGIQQLALYKRYRNFIDLCGQLRFQLRWSHTHRVPKTSVLGHMLVVAMFSYLVSLEINACEKRCVNNYLTGLFHDLPEVLTRDIISPVKTSIEGFDEIIKKYEREQMENEVYTLIPEEWQSEIKMYTEDEFSSIITLGDSLEEISSDEISHKYNEDIYSPRDGEIVKAVDDLAAFIEAYLALKNGTTAEVLTAAKDNLKRKYRNKIIANINFGEKFADFD